MTECPSDSILDQFNAGELDDGRDARVRKHLEACADCRARADEMQSRFDGLLSRVRGLKPSDEELKLPRAESGGGGPAGARRSLPNQHFEGYELIREIHHGGQGVVYQAIQKSTKRRVAIKVLLEGPYASEAARRRFEREIDLVASLKHPHIVAIFDSGETADGRQFYVMDYVTGERLSEYVRNNSLSLEKALVLFAEICEAVNAAHQKGVIHRDLKPWNIVVEPDGHPKILDFGLAKAVVEQIDPLLSLTGQVMGTPAYMSPEQARGKTDEVDVRTDVYALGIIVYEMLTGAYPYEVQGEMAEVLRNITRAVPQPPSKAWTPGVGIAGSRHSGRMRRIDCPIDNELETIVLKALSKERDRRYQSAGELARDVRHYLAGEPIDAKRDSGWYLLRTTVRRYKGPIAVAAAFGVLVTASTIALLFMYGDVKRLWEHAQNQATAAQAQRDKARAAEALAQQRFEEGRALARAFIFDFHDKIADLAGSLPARQLLVTKALDYLNNLSQTAERDPGLMRDLAEAYSKVGDLQGGVGPANLGDSEGALKSFQRAMAMLEAARRLDPSRVSRDRRSIGVLHNRLGDVYWIQGDRDASMDHYRQALEIFQELAAAAPDDLKARRDVGISQSRIGEMLMDANQLDEALPYLEKAQAVGRELCKAEPDNLRYRSELTVDLHKLAGLHVRRGEPEAALEKFRQIVDISASIVADDPNSVMGQRGMSIGYNGMGRTLFVLKRNDEAMTCFKKSVAIDEDVAAADLKNAQAQRDLYISYSSMAAMLHDLDRYNEAIDYSERCLAIAERLHEADPASDLAKMDLAVILANFGSLLVDVDRCTEAIEHLKRALRLNEALQESGVDPFKLPRNRGICLQALGAAYSERAKDTSRSMAHRLEDWRKARAALKESKVWYNRCKERNLLAESELSVFDEVRDAIALCDEAIAALEAGREPPSKKPTSAPAERSTQPAEVLSEPDDALTEPGAAASQPAGFDVES